jgi:hypothetical protein
LNEPSKAKETFKARLIEMVREGANGAQFQSLLNEVTTWLKEQAKDDVGLFFVFTQELFNDLPYL